MAVFTYPHYYKNFHCTGGDCTETCCQKWEIDIDQKTLDYWNSIEGDMGEKIRSNLHYAPDGTCSIQMNEKGYCPFLAENGLCSLYIDIGVEHLSDICNEHPRFYNWFSQGREAGMGICCEEVAKMVLADDTMCLCQEEENQPLDDYTDEEIADENFLFEKRAEIQKYLQGEYENFDLFKSANVLFSEAVDFQDEFFFENTADDKENYSKEFLTEDNILQLIDLYQSFEINSHKWTETLERIKKNIGKILSAKDDFLKKYPHTQKQYASLMWYFIYRYFTQSFDDYDIIGKVNFAIVSVFTILILDIEYYVQTGDFTFTNQVDIVKLYSQEIEYDTDNMQAASQFFI